MHICLVLREHFFEIGFFEIFDSAEDVPSHKASEDQVIHGHQRRDEEHTDEAPHDRMAAVEHVPSSGDALTKVDSHELIDIDTRSLFDPEQFKMV